MALTHMTKPYIYPNDVVIMDKDRITNIQSEIFSTKGKQGATAAAMGRFLKKINRYRFGYTGTPTMYRIFGYGSSVGVPAGGLPVSEAPVQIFFEHLKAKLDVQGIVPMECQNNSVGGSSINDFLTTQWPATVATGIYPDLAFLVYGMNDFATALVNSGATFGPNGFEARLRKAVQLLKDAGSDVVLTTTPHPHTGRMDYNLPSTIDMSWPWGATKPVSGDDIRPTLANSTKSMPWRGGTVPVSTLFLWGNQIIRQVASDMGCLLLDSEKTWFDALLTYTEDELFNKGQVNHPNRLGHRLSYWAAIEYFFDNLETGTWYDGGNQYPLTMQTSGPANSSYANPCTADIDLQAAGERQYAQIFRDRWQRPTMRVTQDGRKSEFWYTNDAPNISNPGYVAALHTRLDRSGVKVTGDTVTYTIAARQGAKLRFHAWSSSLGNVAEMVELLVVRSDNGYYVTEVGKVKSDTIDRIFSYSVSTSGVTFTFLLDGTVYTCKVEEFGASYS